MALHSYRVLQDGFIHNTFRSAGALVSMSERQARYLLLAGIVEIVDAPAPAAGAVPVSPPPTPRRRVTASSDPERAA